MRGKLLIAVSAVAVAVAAAIGIAALASEEHGEAAERVWTIAPVAPAVQTRVQADAKSAGCMDCHRQTDLPSMHTSPAVVLGCTDCHGGDAAVRWSGGSPAPDAEYAAARDRAHVLPRYPQEWRHPASANPERSYALLNREAPEFIRFVNPSDYRVVREACGACHLKTILAAERSLMSTNAMFWGGAAYNNGLLPYKKYRLGEAYTRDGRAAIIEGAPASTEEREAHGILPRLYPLPRWQNFEPADVFRVFEDGGRNLSNLFPETGLPNVSGQIQRLEEPGRPDIRQSSRGRGTGARIAVPVLNLHKTRLNDPLAWFLGTNDQPGDYRSSGCGACHVVYANDRDPRHSGPYARFGHAGETQTADAAIPQGQPGHPLTHAFTRAIPTSQCMVCHMHQPNMFLNTFLGYTMWDYESDAPSMWPKQQRRPTDAEMRAALDRNPEGAVVRGLWADPEFLRRVSELNPTLKDTQFADYHGHGWNFRGVYKRDRKGRLLDAAGGVVADDDPAKFSKTVHLSSIHVDVGMHCVDCHFSQDAHGNGHLYGEVAQAVEIDCKDCHGSVSAYPTLRSSGPAAGPNGSDLSVLRNPDGRRRFEWLDGRLIQRSALEPSLEWKVSLVKDSVTPGNPRYNEKAARAKLMSRDPHGQKWGPAIPTEQLAHSDDQFECYACHTSWTNACGGCHLPIEANWKTDAHRYEGGSSRNWASYNPQVARDDFFMLGLRGPAEGGKLAPVRSSSALVLSSTNANRERIYVQQPPIAASGYSSQAMNPHYPHTERLTETRVCSDCHLSAAGDNNAVLAQTLGQGTRFMNLLGFHAWIGTAAGVVAVQVTEWEEPQAVIGSYLQRYAYPDDYASHVTRSLMLPVAQPHDSGSARCLQLRGEYLYVAAGARGLVVYDAASIANKGVSQRLITAPFSPLGQDTRVRSKDASCVALPTTQPVHPARNNGPLMRADNLEQPFAPIYNYALVTDRQEGLILVDVNTLADGDFRNNRLTRTLTWNPGGRLDGARHVTIGGNYAYVIAASGLVVVDLTDPLAPAIAATVPLRDARASTLQFRYLFVTDADGLDIIDVTHPEKARRVPDARLPLAGAQGLSVARTYAYVADGSEGLAIVDVERPLQPRLLRHFGAGGEIADARDVVIATTNASLFAYVADGDGGFKVLQLTAPDTQPDFYGFSPEPRPQLIARYATRAPALALSRPLERDRAVDETGGQIAVFGRRGSRPLNGAEMRRLYLDENGEPWHVQD